MKKRKNNKNVKNKAFISKNDPFGSYTGNPLDGQSPIQDVDDL